MKVTQEQIERFQASKAEYEQSVYEEGRAAGWSWADAVLYPGLAPLAKLRDAGKTPWIEAEPCSDYYGGTPAGSLAHEMRSHECESISDFWEDAVGRDVDYDRLGYARGFAEGALAFWDQVNNGTS